MKHIKGIIKTILTAIIVAWIITIPFIVADRVFGWISRDTYYKIWDIIIILTLIVFIGQYIIKIRKKNNTSTNTQDTKN